MEFGAINYISIIFQVFVINRVIISGSQQNPPTQIWVKHPLPHREVGVLDRKKLFTCPVTTPRKPKREKRWQKEIEISESTCL